MSQNMLALIFAGSKTARLSILEEKRTNTAIPFGGNYRLIDFSLSNLSNSEITQIGLLTQYRPSSLIEHIDFGKPWDLIGRTREIKMLPPYTAEDNNSWYKGTADAIYQNIDYLKSRKQEHVVFLSGEDVYKFDFNELFRYHNRKKADVTIVGKYVDYENLSRFGIIQMDDKNRVIKYSEKPKNPKENLVFISIAILKKNILIKAVEEDAKNELSKHNFAADILPKLIKTKKTYVYINKQPWNYIGNIKEYWEASMKMLSNKPEITPEKWGIRTNLNDRDRCYRKPAFIKNNGNVKNSSIGKGCEIDGEVISSIIFPGVKIGKQTVIKHSIIMHDCQIGKKAFIDMSVLDKDIVVGDEVNIGVGQNIPNQKEQHYDSGITVIGKKVKIPQGMLIGKNCLIADYVNQYNFEENSVPSGSSIFK